MKRAIFASITIFMAAAVPASANYLLLTPTGATLTTAQVRAEAAISPGGNNGEYYWLGTGLMQVEVNVLQRNPRAADKQSRLGAQWSFLPETSFTPAVGFGVIDVTSASPEGIAGYVAITKHFAVPKSLGLVSDFAATAGLGAHGIDGFFGSFEAHFAYGLFAEGEYDSRDFNGAVGWQPLKMLRFKVYSIKDEVFYGAEIPPIQF